MKISVYRPLIFAVFLLLAMIGANSCNRAPQNPTTVLIVRHAEKASDADDSPLNEAGVQRAQKLMQLAEDYGVQAIYSSQFKRNRDTAQPLSDKLKIPVTEMSVNLQNPSDYGKLLAKDILEKHAGQTIVVVGHGNTIASTIEALAGRPVSTGEIAYRDLFVVTIPPTGNAKVLKAQYGF
jgi:broad specificity phosphatase PhoE